jgi:hypothetical protein
MSPGTRRSTLRAVLVLGPALLAAGVLAWPMLFTTSGLGGDWQHHLWYVWRQSLEIRADHLPSMFLNSGYSVLYPLYAFYGGTIYALAGTLSVILDDSPLSAYVLSYVLGFIAAYGGWYWIARTLGCGRWLAQVPALLFVSSACYLTIVYGIGDWPEFLAMSMLPLMIGAGLSILGAERLHVLPAVALAVSSIVFFGSHILTVLWACTLIALLAGAVIVCVPDVRRRIRRRALIRLALVLVPAALVNAWFLLPMAAYASHTHIGSEYAVATETLGASMQLVSFEDLFTLSRASTYPGVHGYILCLPTLAILWVIASIVILLPTVRRGTWMRMLLIFSASATAIVVLMTHAGLVLALPKPYTLLQFGYRLEVYVLMCVVAAVLAVLMLLRARAGPPRLWAWTISPVLALSAIGAVQQVGAYPRTPLSRSDTLTYRGEVFAREFDDYSYVPLPFISEAQLPALNLRPDEIKDGHVSVTTRVPLGQLVATNIGGGPDLLRFSGASVAGIDARSQLVLAVGAPAAAGSADPHSPPITQRISVAPAQGLPVVLGRLLSLLSAAVLIAGFIAIIVRDRRRRRAQTSHAQPSARYRLETLSALLDVDKPRSRRPV